MPVLQFKYLASSVTRIVKTPHPTTEGQTHQGRVARQGGAAILPYRRVRPPSCARLRAAHADLEFPIFRQSLLEAVL